MRYRVLGVIFVAAVAGCGGMPLDSLQNPEQLTVFSIDGRSTEAIGDHGRGHGVPKAVGEFHGCPVLGSVEITDPGERQRLVAALKDGVARAGPVAGCYSPRHGLRIVEKGRTVEYVICIECNQFEEFEGGRRLRHKVIDGSVQSVFDQPLKVAAVPIAPD